MTSRHPHYSQPHWKQCPCPECMAKRDARTMWAVIVVALVLGFLALGFLGCSSTVVPSEVRSEQASFDQGEQTSGILATAPGGFVVTSHFRDRFNALADLYGRAFSPALVRDAGLRPFADDTWFITPEAMTKFIQMNRWKKSGRAPFGPTQTQ